MNNIINEQNQEVWKNVSNYEDFYQVSNLGRIRSLDRYIPLNGGLRLFRGQIICPVKSIGGYYVISLCKDGKRKGVKVSRVVAQTFITNPLNLPQVNHKNFDKSDNRIENLEWCTSKENIQHAIKNGKFPQPFRGEKHINSKLTDKQVFQIKKIGQTGGLSDKDIGLMFGVSRRYINRILNGKRWTHIQV